MNNFIDYIKEGFIYFNKDIKGEHLKYTNHDFSKIYGILTLTRWKKKIRSNRIIYYFDKKLLLDRNQKNEYIK